MYDLSLRKGKEARGRTTFGEECYKFGKNYKPTDQSLINIQPYIESFFTSVLFTQYIMHGLQQKVASLLKNKVCRDSMHQNHMAEVL